MSNLPYNKFELCKDDLMNYANNIIMKKAYILVENGGQPTKVLLGKRYYKDWKNITSFWIGSFGAHCSVEFSDEDILEVL